MTKPTLTEVGAPSAPTADTAPTTGSAPTADTAPSAPTKRRKKPTATGPLKGRPRPGTVEYEAFRQQSSGGHPYPWRTLDEMAERKIECTSRVNQWEYEVLRYVAALEHKSISKFVLEHAMRAALLRVLEQEKKGPVEQQAG